MTRQAFISMVAIGALSTFAGPALAKSDTKEKIQMSQNATVTIDQAIKSASDKVPGKVIEAELEKKHDKAVWEVEIVTADNKIQEIHVDPMSGDVIDVEEKGAGKMSKKK